MNTLQPKHIKLSEKEATEFLNKLNISKSQLPKILLNDPALPQGCNVGDIVKIERKIEDGGLNTYFRAVI